MFIKEKFAGRCEWDILLIQIPPASIEHSPQMHFTVISYLMESYLYAASVSYAFCKRIAVQYVLIMLTTMPNHVLKIIPLKLSTIILFWKMQPGLSQIH